MTSINDTSIMSYTKSTIEKQENDISFPEIIRSPEPRIKQKSISPPMNSPPRIILKSP